MDLALDVGGVASEFISLLNQPRAAAVAAERKAVCFDAVTLLLLTYFIVEAHISALAERICVILVSFDRVSLRFLFPVQTSDRSDP